MTKNTSYMIVGATSLIALVSIGSAMSLSSKNKAAKAQIQQLQTQIASMEAAVPDATKEPEIIYLTNGGDTNEVTALKTALAEKDAQLQALQTSEEEPQERNRENRPSWEERMAQMKEEDPEGYAEMIKNREERQQRMQYNLAERTATFMDLDTSMMTEEELANHEKLVTMMAQVWEMSEQFNDPEAAPDREAMREMWELSREVQPLMTAEREVMLKQLGAEVGYEGEDATAFAEYIDEIYDTTSMRSIMGGRRGGGGNRGGGR